MLNTKKNNTLNILAPFRYISIGFITVISNIISFFKYMCLGSYYVLFFFILKPIHLIKSLFESVFFSVKVPTKNKKDKAIKVMMNYNEKGEKILPKDKPKSNFSKIMNTKIEFKKKSPLLNNKTRAKYEAERNELLTLLTNGEDTKSEKPLIYKYKAIDKNGKLEIDTFMALSKLDIYTFLTNEGYNVYSIETSDWLNKMNEKVPKLGIKFNDKDLIFFITQLATYIKAGITLTEAMRILEKQLSKNKKQHTVMRSIVYYLTMGEAFSTALERQGNAFPTMAINMIKAAEAAGTIEETLDDLGNYYTELNATKKQMKSAMTYPAFVAVFSMVVIMIIMTKIIPKFVGIYDSAGAELNKLTLFIIAASNFLVNYAGYIVMGLIVIGLIFMFLYKKNTPFRRSIQTMLMKIPVVGNIIIYNEITIFTKTFASLIKNDVFITESMKILSKLTNNEIYKDIMLSTVHNISTGGKISDTFANHWAVPDIAYYMIVTGENTGQLAKMMSKVSTYYQEQHASMINSLKSLIEPMMIIFLAVTVGGILIAVVLPMFQLYGQIMPE